MERVNLTGQGSNALNICPAAHTSQIDSPILDRKYIRFYRSSIAYNYVSQTRFQSKLSKVSIYCRPQKGGGYSPLNVDENPKGGGL